MLNPNEASISSNFELKSVATDLIPSGDRTVGLEGRSVLELEALRTTPSRLSASKFGLEVICGASCDTGAQ